MKKIKTFGKYSTSSVIYIFMTIILTGYLTLSVILAGYLAYIVYQKGFYAMLELVYNHFSAMWGTPLLAFLFCTTLWLIFLTIFFSLKNIFANFTNNNIFCKNNIISIRLIALAMFIHGIALYFDYKDIFIGILIFMLGEIFKVGDELHNDNNAII